MPHPVSSCLRLAVALMGLLLLTGPAPAQRLKLPLPPEEQDQVNHAIDRGVAYLLGAQNPLGTWGTAKEPGSGGGHLVGFTALPGLTLLECGVPPDNSAVQKAAIMVRANAQKLDATYELALSILFLDRLGEARDDPLIETFALKLIAGQRPSGGWSYKCPPLNAATQRQLLSVLRQLNPGAGLVLLPSELAQVRATDKEQKFLAQPRPADPGPEARGAARRNGPGRDEAAAARGGARPPDDVATAKAGGTRGHAAKDGAAQGKPATVHIPKNLLVLPVLRDLAWQAGQADPKDDSDQPILGKTDNSNSQFALLSLWAAQRHGIPVERTMARVVRRYRDSQNADGGWGYAYAPGGGASSSPAMTCVGLIGLAVGHGMGQAGQPADGKPQDKSIVKGFVTLNGHLGDPPGRAKDLPLPSLYFLWSVERVAVLYNLPKIGNRDWYRWGAESIVANQQGDGSWNNKDGYPGAQPILDTCLALLFMRRANLVADLTNRLPFNPEQLNTDIGKGLGRDSAALKPAAPVNSEPPKPPSAPPSPAPDPTPPPTAAAPPSVPKSTEPPPEPESGGGKKLLLVGAVGLCALLLVGGAAALWFGRGSTAEEPDEEPRRPRKKKKRRVRQDDDG